MFSLWTSSLKMFLVTICGRKALFFLSMEFSLFTRVCAGACVHECVHVCGGQRSTLDVIYQLFYIFFIYMCAVCACICMLTCVLTCVWKPDRDIGCLPWLLSVFWGRVSLLNPGLASWARLSSQVALEILSCARIADWPLHWPSIYMVTEDLNSSPHACPEIALASGPFPELFHLIFWDRVSHWAWDSPTGSAGWSAHPGDPPFSASPVLALRMRNSHAGLLNGCIASTLPTELSSQLPKLSF